MRGLIQIMNKIMIKCCNRRKKSAMIKEVKEVKDVKEVKEGSS